MKNYVLYDAKKFQNAKFEVFKFQNVDFGIQKIFTFSTFFPEMVKFEISFFYNLIFCLSSYDLDKPSGLVAELCWNLRIYIWSWNNFKICENQEEEGEAFQNFRQKTSNQNFRTRLMRAQPLVRHQRYISGLWPL